HAGTACARAKSGCAPAGGRSVCGEKVRHEKTCREKAPCGQGSKGARHQVSEKTQRGTRDETGSKKTGRKTAQAGLVRSRDQDAATACFHAGAQAAARGCHAVAACEKSCFLIRSLGAAQVSSARSSTHRCSSPTRRHLHCLLL